MLGFDPIAGTLRFRSPSLGRSRHCNSRETFCFLSLTTPLQPASQIAGAPVERVPAAAQEREYRLLLRGSTRQLIVAPPVM